MDGEFLFSISMLFLLTLALHRKFVCILMRIFIAFKAGEPYEG